MSDVAELKSIPPAAITFQELRADSYAFVDKTRYIEVLEKTRERFPFIVRPRRFGKTFFTSTLEAYYDKIAAPNFEATFRGTYIFDHKTPLANQFHVLVLDFSGLSSAENLKNGFVQTLVSQLIPFFDKYPHPRQAEVLHGAFESPALLMERFFSILGPDYHQKLYLIIDEYDQFANEILSFDLSLFKALTSAKGMLKDFYSKIKSATRGPVSRVFITGVTSISLDSMTSGFSIAKNFSNSPAFAGLVGFTESELRTLIPQILDASRFPGSLDDVVAQMKTWYNGYRFSAYSRETVFNSSMCFYYLDALNQLGQEPNSLMDPHVSQDLSKIEGLLNLGEAHFVRQVTERALRGEAIDFPAGELQTLNLNDRQKFDEAGVLSALFYFGYLTFSPNDSCSLVVPNRAIRIQFFEYFLKHFLRTRRWRWEPKEFRSVFEAIGSGDPEPLFRLITERFDADAGIHEGLHLGETSFQSLLYGVCLLSGRFTIKTEVEVRGPEKGYIDLLLLPTRPDAARNAFLIELKYFTKPAASDEAVAKALDEARAQTLRYAQGENIRDIPDLKRVAAVFAGTRMKAFKVED